MAERIPATEVKSRLAELLSRAGYGKERFLIERKGKPVAALVSTADLARLEHAEPTDGRKGLLAGIGAWAEYEAINRFIADVYEARERAADRPVTLV